MKLRLRFYRNYQLLLGVEDEVGTGVDGEEAVVGFGFGGEYADCVFVVDKVVRDEP